MLLEKSSALKGLKFCHTVLFWDTAKWQGKIPDPVLLATSILYESMNEWVLIIYTSRHLLLETKKTLGKIYLKTTSKT